MIVRKCLQLFVLASVLSLSANAADKELNVRHFYQDNGCWCGVATLEMIEQYERGSDWSWTSIRQTNLAKSKNNGGVKVGHTSLSDTYGPCGINGGVDTNEMLTMLKFRVPSAWPNQWEDHLLSTGGTPKESKYFHRLVMKSIDLGNLALFAGKTRYQDGTNSGRFSHWYLITGYKDADGNPNTIGDNDGYYIYDSTVGAGLSNVLPLAPAGKFVTHHSVVKELAAINNKLSVIVKASAKN